MKKLSRISIFIITVYLFVNVNISLCTEKIENNIVTTQPDKIEQEETIEPSTPSITEDEQNENNEELENPEPPVKGTQSIDDGTYTIMSIIDTKKFLDIEGGSTSEGAKLQIWDSAKVPQQKFTLKYVGDGFYKIISKKSGKVLTVQDTENIQSSQVIQAEDKDLDTQKWILQKSSESVYHIISKLQNLYLSFQTENLSNGQELQLDEKNNNNTQKFVFVNLDPKNNIEHIKNGIYQIELSSGKVVDVGAAKQDSGANIQIWSNANVPQQKFRITRIGTSDYYKITAIHSTKSLDVKGGKEVPGTNVQQYNKNETDSQCWLFKSVGNGYYNIISKVNGLCLDVSGGKINNNGSNVQMYFSNNTAAQKFKLKQVNIINNNTYEIETKLSSNKVVDISGGSKKEGAQVQIWTPDNVNQQRFKFTAISSDTYKIIAKHSDMALTARLSNNEVYQEKYTGATTQQWQILEKGNGYYSFICKANGRSLGVYQDKAQNGQKLKVYASNKSASRQFRLVTGFRKFYEEGTYGKSGLKIKGDSRGTKLKYYKIGKGKKSFFATFSIHGFEDSYDHDGKELTYIAEEFKKYVKDNITENIVNKYTIYIFPCLNPDGQNYGYTNNGPGRTTLYSSASGHKGIDMNRNWSVEFTKQTSNRNYTGTKAFQAYEAKYLRDFILDHEGKSNILVDTHGWLEETIGDEELGKYYQKQFGLSKHIYTYGKGYLVNWARTLKKGRSTLVELPEVTKHSQVVNSNYAQKWINATMKMLKEN